MLIWHGNVAAKGGFMKYDLRKMEQLVAVARAGSFSRAAQQLHITQPALSRNVAAMERELGVKVFDRGRGGAVVTTVGALVVEEIEQLLQHADRLDHNLEHVGRGDVGRISLGLGPMVGSLLLGDMALEFFQRRPGLHLRAVIKPAPDLLHELLNHRIELFICGREQLPQTARFEIEPLVALPIAMVVRGDHPLAKRQVVKARELHAYPMLSGLELPATLSVGGELVCDNYDVLRDIVQRSDGVWLTSPRMVEEQLACGRMAILNVVDRDATSQTEICLVHRLGYALSPAAEHVRRYVRDYLAPASADNK